MSTSPGKRGRSHQVGGLQLHGGGGGQQRVPAAPDGQSVPELRPAQLLTRGQVSQAHQQVSRGHDLRGRGHTDRTGQAGKPAFRSGRWHKKVLHLQKIYQILD